MSVYGFFADDLTGASDVLAQAHAHGLSAMLVLDPDHVRADAADVVGLAGPARSLSGDALDAEIRTGLAAVGRLDPEVLLYKVCSTFDSSPTVGSIGRALELIAEAYPDLKANQNFLALQQELASTEDRIASGRRYYNANVRELNTKVESVPSNIIAGLAHIGRAEYFEAEGAERQAPQVSFGGPGAGAGQIGPGAPTTPTTPTGPQDTIRPAAPVDPPQGS